MVGNPPPRDLEPFNVADAESEPTCIAVDWSGARTGSERRIWLAEVRAGDLVRLENGRSAADLARQLIDVASRVSYLIVGLDFAFSFPGWFLDEHLAGSAHELWRLAEQEGESWLAACEPPFWGRPGRPRPADALERGYRQAELMLDRRPKSVFQIGGAGSVGTGSLRGMVTLLKLHEAGFRIWPFYSPAHPVAFEIYPRLLTGPGIKSNAGHRMDYFAQRYPSLCAQWAELIAGSEDAFDAAISALVMSQHASVLASLPDCHDPLIRREGCIWYPGMTFENYSSARPISSAEPGTERALTPTIGAP
jgi:hypothetical protein